MILRALDPIALDAGNCFLQSGFWAAFKEKLGWTPMAFQGASEEVDFSLLLLIRKVGGFLPFGYAPHGPELKTPLPGQEESGRFLSGLSQQIQEYLPLGTLFARYDLAWEGERISSLRKVPIPIQIPDTIVVDLGLSEEDLLARMRRKTRYNIRLAERRGVSVVEGTTEEALTAWYALYLATSRRHGTVPRSLSYFQTLFALRETYRGTKPQLKLLLAHHKRELLAGIVLVLYGREALFLYGGSSEKKREFMPAYALHWWGIRWAKQEGCSRYDFFGIAPSQEDVKHRLYGLYQFKSGFGGRIVHRLGAWDYPYTRVIYPLYRLAERGRSFYHRRICAQQRAGWRGRNHPKEGSVLDSSEHAQRNP